MKAQGRKRRQGFAVPVFDRTRERADHRSQKKKKKKENNNKSSITVLPSCPGTRNLPRSRDLVAQTSPAAFPVARRSHMLRPKPKRPSAVARLFSPGIQRGMPAARASDAFPGGPGRKALLMSSPLPLQVSFPSFSFFLTQRGRDSLHCRGQGPTAERWETTGSVPPLCAAAT